MWTRGTTCLGFRVVLGLVLAPGNRPPLIGVDQVVDIVARNTGGARVHQGLDARLPAHIDDALGAVDIDLLVQPVVDLAVTLGDGRGGVDDDVRADLVEDGGQAVRVGDVGVKVRDAVRVGAAVAVAPQVNDGHGGGPVAQKEAHDVVAQEAASARDEDSAKVGFLF